MRLRLYAVAAALAVEEGRQGAGHGGHARPRWRRRRHGVAAGWRAAPIALGRTRRDGLPALQRHRHARHRRQRRPLRGGGHVGRRGQAIRPARRCLARGRPAARTGRNAAAAHRPGPARDHPAGLVGHRQPGALRHARPRRPVQSAPTPGHADAAGGTAGRASYAAGRARRRRRALRQRLAQRPDRPDGGLELPAVDVDSAERAGRTRLLRPGRGHAVGLCRSRSGRHRAGQPPRQAGTHLRRHRRAGAAAPAGAGAARLGRRAALSGRQLRRHRYRPALLRQYFLQRSGRFLLCMEETAYRRYRKPPDNAAPCADRQ
ncbi:Uncharacterised protein [Bordetella pertussis]|nr:Uncharacterised protein [Bordetella pertussis]CFM36194.1 Uncharacterised protein [Bordetella pertussis]CFM81814.1 Uncharacterised protein [Bordetella pertussis]CFU74556.1 Uncharacterised protein [Bordetella pertussis]CPK81752.1 Uncharacterised protein [Bordetella pertussis]